MITKTKIAEMIADSDTLIITDPCYILKQEDWQAWLEQHQATGIELADYLNKTLNFGEVLAGETGVGDWTNNVTNTNTNEVIGTFSADAGMVIVCTASDLTNYGYDYEKFHRLQEDFGCIAVIPDYTGTISLENTINSRGDKLAVITGKSDTDFNFTTNEMQEVE